MSTQSDSDSINVLILANKQSVLIGNYTMTAIITLLILDYILNLDREVQTFWKRPRSTAALLYFATRCGSLISAALEILTTLAVTSPNMCNVMNFTTFTVGCFQIVPGALFSALRIYGLTKNSVIASLVLLLALVPMGPNLSTYATGIKSLLIPTLGCFAEVSATPLGLMIGCVCQITSVIFAAGISVVTSDILLIGITLRMTPRRGLFPDKFQVPRRGLMDVVYRDGMSYLFILFLMDIFSIVVNILLFSNIPTADNALFHFARWMTTFVFPVGSILVAHFLLDLQEASKRTLRLNPDDPLYSEAGVEGEQSSLNFARIVGSLGAVIEYSASNEEQPVEEDE